MLFGLIPTVNAQATSPCGAGRVGGVDLGDCLQLSDSTKVSAVYTDPAFLVNLIVRNLFVLAGVILFLMFIVAGYKFILGGAKGAEEANSIVTTAITGFIIMFAAYWIVQIVSLLTGINIPGITIGTP